jgi:adenosine deaminase
MQWILCVPRDEPRRGDEVARWTMSAAARKAGVVALGLTGAEDIQPVGQFERAFRSVEKKGVPRVVQAGDKLMAEGILEAINMLNPDRILDGWGTADAPDVQQILRDKQIVLSVCMAKALCFGQAATYSAYPLRALYDEDLRVTIGSGLPNLYKTTLNDEYLAAAEHCDFAVDEIEELALNSVHAALLSPDEKEAMLSEFTKAYQDLRVEHIASEQA